MKHFALFFILTYGSFSIAKPNNNDLRFQKTLAPYIKTITSTNNIDVLISKVRSKYRSEVIFQIKSSVKKFGKVYFAKKVSSNSFAVKLSNGKWARFTVKPGAQLFIGNQQLDPTGDTNFNQVLKEAMKIVKDVYYPKKASIDQLFINPAVAKDQDETAVSAAIAGIIPSMSEDPPNMVDVKRRCTPDKTLKGTKFSQKEKEDFIAVYRAELSLLEGRWSSWSINNTPDRYYRLYFVRECLVKYAGLFDEPWFHPSYPENRVPPDKKYKNSGS